MTNPFEAYAASDRVPSPVRAKHRAQDRREAEKAERVRAEMVPSPLERKQMEQAELARLYRAWRREVKAKIVRENKEGMAALSRIIRNLSTEGFDAVLEYVQGAQWLLEADENTRLATLSYIDVSMCRARVRDGRPPMDDGLWDEPPSHFVRIRKVLLGI